MKYKYITEEKTIEVPKERWCWGVIYKPTPEAIKIAERETEERNQKLKEERNKRINTANKLGILGVKRKEIYNWYNKEISRLIRPFMDEFHQFDNDGYFHKIGEIDQDRIYMASLYKADDISKRIDIPWREGMRIIHKYTNVRPAGEEEFKRIYVFGFKYQGKEHLNYITPEDRIIMLPDQEVDLVEIGI